MQCTVPLGSHPARSKPTRPHPHPHPHPPAPWSLQYNCTLNSSFLFQAHTPQLCPRFSCAHSVVAVQWVIRTYDRHCPLKHFSSNPFLSHPSSSNLTSPSALLSSSPIHSFPFPVHSFQTFFFCRRETLTLSQQSAELRKAENLSVHSCVDLSSRPPIFRDPRLRPALRPGTLPFSIYKARRTNTDRSHEGKGGDENTKKDSFKRIKKEVVRFLSTTFE